MKPAVQACTLYSIAVLVAGVAVLHSAVDVQEQSVDLPGWLSRTLAVINCLALLRCGTLADGRRSGSAATMAITVLAFALFMPAADEAVAQLDRAAWALPVCLLAALLVRRNALWGLGAAMTTLACFLDATALTLPVAAGWLSFRGIGRRKAGVALCLTGVAGVAAAVLFGWPLTPVRHTHDAWACHRDLVRLLPVLMVGLGAWLGRGSAAMVGGEAIGTAVEAVDGGAAALANAWAGASLVALGMVVVGLPVTPATATLGLWCWVPAGLTDLRRLLSPNGYQPGRRCAQLLAAACIAAGVGFSLPASQRWLDGALLGLYVLEKFHTQ